MSHKNLAFFNKEGDNLNFRYDEKQEIFQGDILFHENSTDTFKTYGLYTLERKPSFDFEDNTLGTNKFQLFNEYGFNFYGCNNNTKQIVTKIEPVNNDPNFYSKWIYGENFESLYKVGSLIRFDSNFLEFTNINQTFVVTATKKGAILIISTVDNLTFEETYYSIYEDNNSYINITISGIDAVGIRNYIDTNYVNNLSEWSEPNFYDSLYRGKKLNVVNSNTNDGVYTVVGPEITDIIHFRYSVKSSDIPINSNIIIEVVLGTDLPKLYDGGLDITTDNRIYVNDYLRYPTMLNIGEEFKVVGSQHNDNFFTVADIMDFSENNSINYYELGDQVLYNGKLYQCVQAYTHSHVDESTKYITPKTSLNWSNPTYIGVNEVTIAEPLYSAQIYLTKDKYYYEYGWTQSSSITLAGACEKFNNDISMFNIDMSYSKNHLDASLVYPSRYSVVNFYHTEIGASYSIGSSHRSFERLIEVKETFNSEFNNNFSENFKYNIVFIDLDEYGLKIVVNEMVYEEEIVYVYSGIGLDMQRTIDKTLRNWLTRNYLTLYKLGINVELNSTYVVGQPTSLFYNSIMFVTEYPNVPMIISDIMVGSTANYFVEHSRVTFNDIGANLNININNRDYRVSSVLVGLDYDINLTLKYWMSLYSKELLERNIDIIHSNKVLVFNTKNITDVFSYKINIGKIDLPGSDNYIISNKIKGNEGVLIASNEVILSATSSNSFEDAGFATGMVFSINNTYYPWVNQEYNVEFLDPKVINLSYQGPFWDVNNTICNKSPFVTIAFNLGFGQTSCDPMGATMGGEFNNDFDNTEFNMAFYPNDYTDVSYDSTTNLVDIKYIQFSNTVITFGDDIVVNDSYTGTYITTIELNGNVDSIKMEFNNFNNFLYCLSKNKVWVIDPSTNVVYDEIDLTSDAYDLQINPFNGDVYISYENVNKVDIIKSDFVIVNVPTSNKTYKMVFNEFEKDMYVNSIDNVFRIDGVTRTHQATYSIIGVLPDVLFYEPVNESIFVFGDTYLSKIDNGVTSTTTFPSKSFNDIIFNSMTGEMNISNSDNQFHNVSLSGDVINQYSIGSYGFMAINQYEGAVYISSQSSNSIIVVDSTTQQVKQNTISATSTKLVYNPDRKSIWAIQPSINKVVEIEVQLNNIMSEIIPLGINDDENRYGSLDPDFIKPEGIWLKTRDYFRRPRESFEGDVEVHYYWKWFSDNVSEFFMYDFSGEQLDRVQIGSYSYTGEKPLSNIVLNRLGNKDINKISQSEYQQTIFDKTDYKLSYIDDEYDIYTDVTPLELFIGFKSENEGALRSILQLYKSEDIKFTINSSENNIVTLTTLNDGNDKRGLISLNTNSIDYFSGRGLKPGQHIAIYLKDNTNNYNQYISHNNGTLVKIREVYSKSLVVDFINIQTDILEDETTFERETYLDFSIKVVDKEIGRFFTYGQTEEEDIRFKVELGNVGKLVAPDDVFIFKEYDIEEGGIDWLYLNKKRKEMMMMKHLIYPYIGSYKSIINAINFFGYNDLQLNEYYRNVDAKSANFSKLFKVEIPDIFDNSVEGWTSNDFIEHTMPNDNYDTTNLFNLTYSITDKEGNNVLNYTLDEVIIKLQGLKYWLKKNIIPLTHKILDITGRSYFTSGFQVQHRLHDVKIYNINDNMTPIYFRLNEAYLMPVNSGSTVYNCVLDLYTIIPNVGAEKNDNILPYNGKIINAPDYFDIKIRTYKTYREWAPFKKYSIGDKVIYYDRLYESVKNNNKVNSPRKYEDVYNWVSEQFYDIATVVKHNNDYYVSKDVIISTINPSQDLVNWDIITEWREIKWEPVQTLNEFRNGDNLLPFNFTIDSNLDPFIVIEVASDNGYGCVYNDRKNYEIRGIKDITEDNQDKDKIGPFEPIVYL